jgi:branched-chain amino acid transport system ATP-binding protein
VSLLEVRGLSAGYGSTMVLRQLDIQVAERGVTVILGANGAGKTTLLRALSGLLPVKGSVRFRGEELAGRAAARFAAAGIAHVPQGRGTFTDLSVLENLHVGAHRRSDRAEIRRDIDHWFSLFPRLHERRDRFAGTLSGGEQQMLAVARAMMMRPALLLLDEPSLGLAPLITQQLFTTLGSVRRNTGTTILLVEQNAHLALEFADFGYVLEAGSIAIAQDAAALKNNEALQRSYLGY